MRTPRPLTSISNAYAATLRIHLTNGRARLVALFVFTALITSAGFAASSSASPISNLLFGNSLKAAPSTNTASGVKAFASAVTSALNTSAMAADSSLSAARKGHTATRLDNGKVLIVGGDAAGTAEVYDPTAGSSSALVALNAPRAGHMATKLADGRVLITGGHSNGVALASTVIYDPTAGGFSAGPNMNATRGGHTATTLTDGRILIAGGDAVGSAEIYDPASNIFTLASGTMNVARSGHSAALLKDGRVLLVGGEDAAHNEIHSAEIFDLATHIFTPTANEMAHHRTRALLRVLPDGKVQIIGGNDDKSMEVYDPAVDTIGAHGHLIPVNDEHAALMQNDILSAPTRAALFHHGQTDALLDRENHSITETTNQALVAGGVNTSGNVLNSFSVLSSSSATVTTDKLDYAPGQTAVISGTNWQAGEIVDIILHEDPHTHTERRFTATADANGIFSVNYLVEAHDLWVTFVVGVKGQSSGRTAQTTFTDNQNPSIGNFSLLASDCTSPATAIAVGSQICASMEVIDQGGSTPADFYVQWIRPDNSVAQITKKGPSPQTVTNAIVTDLSPTLNVAGQWSLATCKGNYPSNKHNQPCTGNDFIAGTAVPVGTLQVAPATGVYGGTVNLSATLSGNSGPVSGKTISFKLNGSSVGTATTNVSGVATLTGVSLAGINAGTYSPSPTSGVAASFAGDSTLAATNGSNTLTVNKAQLTVTASAASRAYGASDPSFSATISGFVNGETETGLRAATPAGLSGQPSFSTNATATSPVGNTYTITPALGTLQATNYSFQFASGTLTITQATLTVTAESKSREYGDANPAFTFQIDGFKNGETASVLTSQPTCTSSATAASPASPPAYSIVCSGGASGNYNFNYVNGALTVTKAPLTVTGANKSREYGDANPTLTGTITGIKNSDNITATYATAATQMSPVGTYSIVPTLVDPDSKLGNYVVTSNNGTLTVTAAVLTVTANDKSRAYGAANPSFDVAVNGFKNGETLGTSGVTGMPTCTTTATATSSVAGSPYPISCAAGSLAATNYTFSFVSGALTVTKANLTVTADNKSRSYGAANPSFTYAVAGFVNGEDATTANVTGSPILATTATPASAVGNYAITVAVGSLSAPNYNFTPVNGNLEITKAVLTVSADNQSKTYGDVNPVLTYSVSGYVNGENAASAGVTGNATLSTTAATNSAVGSYPIKVDSVGTLAATNYNFVASAVDGTLTILARAITVTADAKTKTYGDADPALTYQITSGSLVAGDGFSGGLTRAAGESVGTYAIGQGTLLLSSNYVLTFVGADLTITARPITVKADAKTKTYGDTDPALTYQITSGSLAFSDAFAGALTRAAGENAGTYAIQQGTLALGSNYALTYIGADLTINARPVTVTADAKSKVYGDGDPALTYQITSGSLAFSDTFTGALSRVAGENVGTYAIVQGTLALNGNYALTYVGANLTINARPITVTADAKSKVYGDPDPALTYQITGGSLAFSDALTGALTRAAGESVGTYAIQQGTLALNGNYTLTYVGAILTITPKAASVTPGAASKTYGDADPALTGTLVGFLSADGVTATYSRTAGETVAVSPYTISATLSPAGVLGNYNITYNTASFTINKAALTITAADKSRTYGAANPPLTGSIVGLKNGDQITATYSTSATAASAVGDYPIIPAAIDSTPSTLSNYDVTLVNGKLTVNKAVLTVTADDKSKTYGQNNPMLTGTLTGVQNGDQITASYSTTATAASPAGGYPITPELSDPTGKLGNYNVTLTAGTLTVTKALLTVSVDSKQKIQGGQNPPLTATITGFQNGETLATSGVIGQPALSTTADVASPPAVYPITAGIGTLAAANYNFAFVNGTLTVTPNQAPVIQTVSANIDPIQIGSVASVNATFTDADVLESSPYTATINWGDGTITTQTSGEPVSVTAPPLTPAGATGSIAGSHKYTVAGVYTVTVTVSDKIPGTDSEMYQYVVIYDPNGGFVTGGGWIMSPAGAYVANPNLTGKANFGFVSKYKNGQSVPTGETEFQFKAGNFNFHSTAYEWMVISGPKVRYKGTGTVNGQGSYGFELTAIDGQVNGGGGIDKFRIKIWDQNPADVVYDNNMGAVDGADPSTAISGGNITIHSGK